MKEFADMQDLERKVSSSDDDGVEVLDCLSDGLSLEEDTHEFTSPEEMRSERARFQTFPGWSESQARKLAGYGFYCVKDGDCVRCAFCGLEISKRSSLQNIELWHWQYARTYCPFLKGEDVGNVPADTRTASNVNATKKGAADSRTFPRIERLFLLGATPGIPSAGQNNRSHTAAANCSPAPHPELVSSSRHTFPQNQNLNVNQTRQTSTPNLNRHHSQHRNRHQTVNQRNEASRTAESSTDNNPTTWLDIVRTARYPQMASFQTRLDTLSTWPLVKPTPTELARAGLFHVKCQPSSTAQLFRGQCEDSVKCFWCGERFHRWQKTDDAILEHARLSPRCHYVIRLIGQQLHDDVVNARTREDDRLYIYGHHQPTFPRPRDTTQSSSRSRLDKMMESAPVQRVLQMGFPRQLIEDLLSFNSEQLTAETLCSLALQAAQESSPALSTTAIPAARDRTEETQRIQTTSGNTRGPPGLLRDEQPGNLLTQPQANVASEQFTLPLAEPAVPSAPLLVELKDYSHREKVSCKVCSEAEVKVIFRPCNHLLCCARCAAFFTRCPLCHHHIEDTLTTYLA